MKRVHVNETILAIEGLSVKLPKGTDRTYAIQDVSLKVRKKEILCVVGESGSGKSVTAFSIMGLLEKGALTPVSGSIRMTDEDLLTVYDALALIEEPLPYGMWNIKLMKSGGVTGGKAIADIGQLRRIPLMWGCMDESIVSISAALHIALSSAKTKYLDLDGSFDLARDIVSGGFMLKDGKLIPTMEPGLGVNYIDGVNI